jgi:hypothetical protein
MAVCDKLYVKYVGIIKQMIHGRKSLHGLEMPVEYYYNISIKKCECNTAVMLTIL